MKNYLTLDSVDINNKTVGIRVDINSAIINNKVEESLRITQACNSIQELLEKNAKVIIFAHQGRKGKPDFTSLSLHKEILEKNLNTKINFIENISSKSIDSEIKKNPKQNIFLIENLRNLDFEQKPQILKNGNLKTNEITKIIELCDYYILDAFSISHRAHSSVLGSNKVPMLAGRLLQKELKPLSILENTPHPKVFVMGGSKPDDLLPLIKQSLEQKTVDTVLLSGVIGEVALHSQGVELGKKWDWIVEHDYHLIEKELKQLIKKYPKQFILPKDVAYLNDKNKRIEIPISKLNKTNKEIKIFSIQDIGTKTITEFTKIIIKSKSCYIKGPQGNFEIKKCEKGTFELFKNIVKTKTFSYMGGGHTVTAAQLSKTIDKFSYVSLAGGALVQFIEGKELPGVKTLEQSYEKFHNNEHFDLVVIGSNVIDTFVNSPEDISTHSLGQKIKVQDNFVNRVGGGGINVSSTASKLKAKVGFISRLSKESYNEIQNCSLENKFSILTSKIRNEESAKSILVQTPKQDRLIFTFRGQNQNLELSDFPKKLPISNYYFSGLTHKSFNTQTKIMQKIKKEQSQSLITYNPSSYTIKTHQEEILNNLKLIDILIFNDEEAELLTQERGIKHNLLLLSSLGPKIIVITQGSKGVHAIDSKTGEIYYQRALSKDNIVDTTGAGDCFAATFFYFIAKKYSTEDSLTLASINSAHLIQEAGSLNGSLNLSKLKKEFYNLKE